MQVKPETYRGLAETHLAYAHAYLDAIHALKLDIGRASPGLSPEVIAQRNTILQFSISMLELKFVASMDEATQSWALYRKGEQDG